MTTTTEHPNWIPIQITRINDDLYYVGAVKIERQEDDTWAATPTIHKAERPLFTAPTLEKILHMAHGACEMMRPADPEPDLADSFR